VQLLIFPLISFTPGIFWLWFFAKRNIYRPGPKRLLAQTFFLGMVSTIPSGIFNVIFLGDVDLDGPVGLSTVAAGMFLVVGPVEETSKFLAVKLGPYRRTYSDEPMDGLVYAAAASLGFASLENLLYVLQFGPSVMLARAPFSTLAHVIFGSFWGYALGLQTRNGSHQSRILLVAGVVAAAVLHGIFNTTLFLFWPLTLIVVGLGMLWTLSRFNWARRVSPFRLRRNYARIRCLSCGQLISILSKYCRYCGSHTAAIQQEVFCSYCSNVNRPSASYCTQCGDRLLR
jgi:RsiW-degrading membrane proteinase PrsW (M82 family)